MAKLQPRPAPPALAVLLLILLGSLAAIVLPRTSEAADQDHPLVARAFEDLGSYQGQCWPWVRRAVADSLGLTMGFDYRLGFFQAGAAEIELADAGPGDVIQLADDSNTNPDADYPGLHTAIIVAVEGPGVFEIIDSNSQWGGIVRTRSGYDPAASAARFWNIDFHIYRFPSPGGAPAPGDPTGSVEAGTTATVVAPDDCLNLRSRAGVAPNNILVCLPDGMEIRMLGPLRSADGYDWLLVETPMGIGWVASAFVAAAADSGQEELPAAAPVHRAIVGAVAANAEDTDSSSD